MRPCAVVLVLVAGLAAGGCAAAGSSSAAGNSSAAGAAHPAVRGSAPVYGPSGLDPACVAALKAQQALQATQGKDQGNESALDRDFLNFASALTTAARHETRPAAASAMTALANDYSAMVESQSGATQLPAMSKVESDGAAFTKAC